MTTDEIVEMAIQGHAGTRDAIRWAIRETREECAIICEKTTIAWSEPIYNEACMDCAEAIRSRNVRTPRMD